MEGAGDGDLAQALERWRDALAGQGWAPTWPKAYGGAGLTPAEARVILSGNRPCRGYNPIPLMRMGVTMVGPMLLEYGTDEQKEKHLLGIASGKIRWYLAFFEPNAGSDLAGLATKAEDKDDHFALNGQKIWTSGADISVGAAPWCAPNPRPRSRRLFVPPMDQPGWKRARLTDLRRLLLRDLLQRRPGRKSDLLGL